MLTKSNKTTVLSIFIFIFVYIIHISKILSFGFKINSIKNDTICGKDNIGSPLCPKDINMFISSIVNNSDAVTHINRTQSTIDEDLDNFNTSLDNNLFKDRLGTVLTIALATKYFKRPKYTYIWEKFIDNLNQCPELKNKCEFTHDSKLFNKADVVAVYMRDRFKLVSPENRPSYQKWVFTIIESPIHTYNNLNIIEHKFNMTMTYRLDSTVPYFYGICEKDGVPSLQSGMDTSSLTWIRVGNKRDPTTPRQSTEPINNNYLDHKEFTAAWFSHNCKAPSRRMRFIKGLQRFIDIHVFGSCGNYTCSYEQGEYCDKTLLNKKYKFYMSLENSFCEGYITEKTFRILDLDVIPVISSHSDLKNILPPHSYIDTRDFSSYEELANYMLKVGSDEKLYAEYFAWKLDGSWRCYMHEHYRESIGCRLCRHSWKNRHRREFTNVLKHWNKRTTCISGEAFYFKYFSD